jgi:hypothetical protein
MRGMTMTPRCSIDIAAARERYSRVQARDVLTGGAVRGLLNSGKNAKCWLGTGAHQISALNHSGAPRMAVRLLARNATGAGLASYANGFLRSTCGAAPYLRASGVRSQRETRMWYRRASAARARHRRRTVSFIGRLRQRGGASAREEQTIEHGQDTCMISSTM